MATYKQWLTKNLTAKKVFGNSGRCRLVETAWRSDQTKQTNDGQNNNYMYSFITLELIYITFWLSCDLGFSFYTLFSTSWYVLYFLTKNYHFLFQRQFWKCFSTIYLIFNFWLAISHEPILKGIFFSRITFFMLFSRQTIKRVQSRL